jgi:hypothetical protein
MLLVGGMIWAVKPLTHGKSPAVAAEPDTSMPKAEVAEEEHLPAVPALADAPVVVTTVVKAAPPRPLTPPAPKAEPKKIEVAPSPAKPPVPAAVAAVQTNATQKRTFKRRHFTTDEDLRKQLVLVPELTLKSISLKSRVLLATAPKTKKYTAEDMPDFAGLPMRMGVDCQLGKEAAENLQILSRKLRTIIAATIPKDGIDTRPNPIALRSALFDDQKSERPEWFQAEAIPTLQQFLMGENKPLRLLLVDILNEIKDRTSSRALAQRALYDLAPEVREAAVRALHGRPHDEYRSQLLDAFRYPWSPVADHAAEALVALDDCQVVPMLVDLLPEPDPSSPFRRSPNQPKEVRELVRVNHLANCLMCHAQSLVSTDPVRGLVPSPSQPLPPPIAPTQYYEGSTGPFVRADVTYLQQDFSVAQPVPSPGAWPVGQRFDYLVRTRIVAWPNKRPARSGEEIFKDDKRSDLPVDGVEEASYEQREAVLFALRELTGKDLGASSDNWRRVFGGGRLVTAE